MPAPKILFVHNWLSSFIRTDLQLLRERYPVTELEIPAVNLKRVFQVWRLVCEHDIVFGWFASRHTFWPFWMARLLRRPSLLVIGGYDLANQPEVGYGHQRGGVKRIISRWTMRLASCLMTISEFSQTEAERNAQIPKEAVTVVYLGLDDPFADDQIADKSKIVLTVGVVKQSNLIRKGHEAFVRTAALLPDYQFVLVGDWEDDSVAYLRSIASSNVVFTGWLEAEAWLNYYRRAMVYVQASSHEGFGMSVAEAMLAGCIPVVTRAGALPEVVGDCGEYVDSPDPQALAQAIRKASESDLHDRMRARERILTHFPLRNRQDLLEKLIESQWAERQPAKLVLD